MTESYAGQPISSEEQHKAVQKNTSYYDLKWGSLKDPAKENSWNWIGFFFYPFWLAYRKMYKLFFFIALLQLPLIILSYLVDMPLWIDVIFYLAIAFAVGRNGNRWYYQHVTKKIKGANIIDINV
ncbi:DUF2628 domain-containing protein [Priestia megaterium]|nr:DUF2628 domain-containing protein [Priestia megaterium]